MAPNYSIVRKKHKPYCFPTVYPHRGKIMKFFYRILGHPHLMSMLTIATAFDYITKWGKAPDPKIFRIATFVSSICPSKGSDYRALTSSEVDFDLLLKKTMMGHLAFDYVLDSTHDPKCFYPTFIEQWRSFRMEMDMTGNNAAPLFIIQFGFNLFPEFLTGPLPIYPEDLERAKILSIAKQRHPDWWLLPNPMLEYVFILWHCIIHFALSVINEDFLSLC